ncbi:MAG: c-type cytochrome, partial [Prosthecobacter sp.]|nr:c-type cytochrome [Prosthecobacter sp.]
VMKHLTLRGPADPLARRIVEALAVALRRSGSSLEQAATAAFKAAADQQSLRWLDDLKGKVMADVTGANVAVENLSHALGLLPDLVSAGEAIPKLMPFLVATQPVEIQTIALEALTAFRNEPEVARTLIGSWKSLSPALREKALSAFLSYPDRITALLGALEAKDIPAAQISTSTRALLTKNKDKMIAERAAKIFGDGASGARKDVITKYEAALRSEGDAARGSKIYELVCMVCHRYKDRGNDVGPNLGTIQAWTPDQLLTNILDPNREVSPNFALYIIETNDGRTLTGLIASETAGNLIVKRPDGGAEEVLRTDIKSLTSPGISLMPEGLEAAITPQQMADLMAYLRQP